MPIAIQCVDCTSRYNVGEHLAGKRVKCRKCGGAIFVPRLAPPPPPAPGERITPSFYSDPSSDASSGEVDFDALVAAADAGRPTAQLAAMTVGAPTTAAPPSPPPPPVRTYYNPLPQVDVDRDLPSLAPPPVPPSVAGH